MDFDDFKRKVISLAKKNKVSHLVPNSDVLFVLYERGHTANEVVQKHCTLEAQKQRHRGDPFAT